MCVLGACLGCVLHNVCVRVCVSRHLAGCVFWGACPRERVLGDVLGCVCRYRTGAPAHRPVFCVA